jgi:hypothetical protein
MLVQLYFLALPEVLGRLVLRLAFSSSDTLVVPFKGTNKNPYA